MRIIDEDAMTRLGVQLAKVVMPGTIIYLEGDLGTGKTTLVRGFLRSLGYSGAVKSPTFTVVEPYLLDKDNFFNYNELEDDLKLENDNNSVTDSMKKISQASVDSQKCTRDYGHKDEQKYEQRDKQRVYHFDLYRLEEPEELEYIGIRDYLDGQAIALIEWPVKGYGVLPNADLMIKITHLNQGSKGQGRKVELLSQSDTGAVIVSKLID